MQQTQREARLLAIFFRVVPDFDGAAPLNDDSRGDVLEFLPPVYVSRELDGFCIRWGRCRVQHPTNKAKSVLRRDNIHVGLDMRHRISTNRISVDIADMG